MGFKSVLFIIHVVLVVHQTNGANILTLFHTPSKSHTILGMKLSEGLLKRGHHVTFVSPYKVGPMENLTSIELKAILEHKEKMDLGQKEEGKDGSFLSKINPVAMVQGFLSMTNSVNELFWKDPNIQKLIQEKPKYDLVIVIAFLHDAMLGIGHHLGAPTIIFNLVGSTSMSDRYMANPTMIYSRNPLIDLPTDNFLGRVLTATSNMLMGYMCYQADIMNQALLDEHLPNSPPLDVLQKNISLMLANSHVSIEPARPYVPNMIQIGGFHVQEVKPLPQEFKTFLDDAKQGAIIFSLGSNVKIESIEEKKREAIFKVLGEISPIRVIFKSELKHEKVPKNIMVKSWVPQADILAHPNIKLFISHGGLGGNTEGVYHGVPILGMPFFGDQKSNLNQAYLSGYATVINQEDITEELFREKIKEMLNNPKYTQNVKRRSALMREQPVKQMDNALFWVEHVIKFGSGSHLRNAGADLSWYQLYMVDIYIFFAIVAILFAIIQFYIHIFVIKLSLKLVRKLFGKSDPKQNEEKVKKS